MGNLEKLVYFHAADNSFGSTLPTALGRVSVIKDFASFVVSIFIISEQYELLTFFSFRFLIKKADCSARAWTHFLWYDWWNSDGNG